MSSEPALSVSAQAFWTARSDNPKTGNIPQQWIGASKQETLASCQGCPLLRTSDQTPLKGAECYAHRGMPKLAIAGVRRHATKAPDLYTLTSALKRKAPLARAVRFAAIGCVCATKHSLRADIANVHEAGLAALAYCHHAKRNADLVGLVTASVDTIAQARASFAAGFLKVALIVPAHTTEQHVATLRASLGVKTTICPADTSTYQQDGRTCYRMTCNQCGLCDGSIGPPTLILMLEKGRTLKLTHIK